MRVGVNALFLIPGEVGGSETYLVETLRACAAGFPADELILFTHLENDAFLRERFGALPQARFVRLAFRASNRYARIVREQAELPGKAARERLDVLWSPGYTAPLAARAPQAVTIYDMQYKRFPQDLSPLARLTTDVLVRAAVRRCARVLTISEFSKGEIVRFAGADPARIDVTPAAVDPVFEAGDPAARRASAERLLGGPGPYLLCVANTYPHKNVEALLRAFATLAPACPHRLVLVGKPRLGEPALQAALAACPTDARARVVRLERAPVEDLVALYQGADVFVFPSLYEGFGLPLLEAMLAGTPVVAADIPTTREVGGAHVRACDARGYAALAHAIRDALDEAPAARAARVAAARAHARRFTWAETARLTRASLARAAGAG